MLTLREAVIEQPFRDRRYRHHRRNVASACPRIDATPPRTYPHLTVKLRQLRLEDDRRNRICDDNIRLAHRMALIMRSKRLDNYHAGPVGPYSDVCPPLPPALRPKKFNTNVRSSDAERLGSAEPLGLLRQVGQLADKRASSLPSLTSGRRVQHRAPAGWCLVPRVGPPSPYLSSTNAFPTRQRPKTAKKRTGDIDGLSVRRQLEPLVALSGDSRQDSDEEKVRDSDRNLKKKTHDLQLDSLSDGNEDDLNVSGSLEDTDAAETEQLAIEFSRNSALIARRASLQRKYSTCIESSSDKNNSTETDEKSSCSVNNSSQDQVTENKSTSENSGNIHANSRDIKSESNEDAISATSNAAPTKEDNISATSRAAPTKDTISATSRVAPTKEDTISATSRAAPTEEDTCTTQVSDDEVANVLLQQESKESDKSHSNFYD